LKNKTAKFFTTFLYAELIPYCYTLISLFLFMWGDLFKKSPRPRRFKSDRNEIR